MKIYLKPGLYKLTEKDKRVLSISCLLLVLWFTAMFLDTTRLMPNSVFTMRWFVLGLMGMVYILLNVVLIFFVKIKMLEKGLKP